MHRSAAFAGATPVGAARATRIGGQAADAVCGRRGQVLMMAEGRKGLFGRLKETILKPIVNVPGSGARGDWESCPFCEGSGKNSCTGCRGRGKDSLGNACLMCDGSVMLTCTVCSGVGLVDRIRRGGTDGAGEFLGEKKGARKGKKKVVE